jgi:hypothetical protein
LKSLFSYKDIKTKVDNSNKVKPEKEMGIEGESIGLMNYIKGIFP